MGKVICISSQKGGVGKTTTAVNLATAFALAEKNTLLVDLDFQAHATGSLGIKKTTTDKCIYDAFTEKTDVNDLIVKSRSAYLKLIPSGTKLLKSEYEIKSDCGKETFLNDLLNKIKEEYSYIIIDSPPSFNFLSVNGINAADIILIPLQCEYYALKSLGQFLKIFKSIKKKYKSETDIGGILITMYDSSEDTSARIAFNVRKTFKDMVFNTVIPRREPIGESAGTGRPIILSDITSEVAKSYFNLAKEIMRKG